jgi:hypothetical protein
MAGLAPALTDTPCAFLATSPTPRWHGRAQLVACNACNACNAGTTLVAVGVPTGVTWLTDAGGGLVALGLVLFAAAL